MASYRILCIEKPGKREGRYQRIIAVGTGVASTGRIRSWSAARVIKAIKEKIDTFYVVDNQNHVAKVIAKKCPYKKHRHFILSTVGDRTPANNLLSLNKCSLAHR
jgi:hypothetical protein